MTPGRIFQHIFILFTILGISIIVSCCHKDAGLSYFDINPSGSSTDSLFQIAENLSASNSELAEIYLQQIKSMIYEDTESIETGKYHLIKGRIYYYQDEYILSVKHLDSAKIIFNKNTPSKLMAKALFFSASSTALIGNYVSAIEDCHQAIEINKQLEDNSSLVICYNYLANIYLQQKDFDRALSYLDVAANLCKQDSLSLSNAMIISSIGTVYLEQGRFKKAEEMHLKAYQVRLLCADIRHIASSLNCLADIYVKLENYDKAIIKLREAEKIYQKLDDKMGLFNVYISYSKAYLKNQDVQNALVFAYNAHEIAHGIQSNYFLEKSSKILADIMAALGKFEEAYQYNHQYCTYHNLLAEEKNNTLISNIKYQKELDEAKRNNEILQKDQQIKNQEISFLFFASIVLVILIILISVLSRQKNQNLRHKQKLIQKEKEMAEAQSSIHEKERLILEHELELKNKELSSKTIELLHQIETLQSITDRIEKLKNQGSKKEVEEILHDLKIKTRGNIWDEFHQAFNNVHKDFYDKLFEICPDLTATEIKIAALLKLNLSSKEIAAISYKSESAVKTARHRLRQKLNLKTGDSLINFLMQLA